MSEDYEGDVNEGDVNEDKGVKSKALGLVKFILGYDIEEFENNSGSVFLNSMAQAKVLLVVFLIVITLLYNYKFSQKWYAKTYFNQKEYAWRVVVDGVIAGILGFVSIMLVFYIRKKNIMNTRYLKVGFLVFFILMLYSIAQESSGLNRYMKQKEILAGTSVYTNGIGMAPEERAIEIANNQTCIDKAQAIINKDAKKIAENVADHSECLTMGEINAGGNPFLKSLSNFSMLILGLIILRLALAMIVATIYGYRDPNNAVTNIKYIFTGENNKSGIFLSFLFETFIIVGIFNSVHPIISPFVRGEKLSKSMLKTVLFTYTMSVILNVMFQYSGAYSD